MCQDRFGYQHFTYLFDGEAVKVLGPCRARCSLNDDCLLRVAGVGNGSALVLDKGVGSDGLEGIALLGESLCALLGFCTSPVQFISTHIKWADSNAFNPTDCGLTTRICFRPTRSFCCVWLWAVVHPSAFDTFAGSHCLSSNEIGLHD